jgi:hypothetical protein
VTAAVLVDGRRPDTAWFGFDALVLLSHIKSCATKAVQQWAPLCCEVVRIVLTNWQLTLSLEAGHVKEATPHWAKRS